MTLLIVPIFGESIDEVRADIARAHNLGADLIELRLDLMEEISEDDLISLCEKPSASLRIILTYRPVSQGGHSDKNAEERLGLLTKLGPYVDYIDLELETWQSARSQRNLILDALKRAGHVSQSGGKEEIEHAERRQLILSRHDWTNRPSDLHTDLLKMLQTTECAVPKLAWRARTVRDNFEAFEMMRQSPKPAIVICMGPEGLASRLLAPKFGAFATFGSLRQDLETATGQMTLDQMERVYRWRSINADTKVFGLIGDPVGHSRSPHLHNAAFVATRINAVYIPFRVDPHYESFKAFMVEALAHSWLDLGGLSITTPHKENALRFLREAGGEVDEVAMRIGSINTIVVKSNGRLKGRNTDYDAILASLDELLEGDRKSLAGKKAVVLGAGGVARAVVTALIDIGAQVLIYNRSEDRAESLAKGTGAEWEEWSARSVQGAAVVVNCTTLGMPPQTQSSPLENPQWEHNQLVFDTIYNPADTSLLRDAKSQGCRTLGGGHMFVHQAAAQFHLWTGQEAPAIFNPGYLQELLPMTDHSPS